MYLEEIELFGFKTFVKTTKIILSDRITCIVGPNGSGKSNIVDALRWVLGEGKLSLLRASESSDLIFSGSSSKQPLNVASIKLIFNNEDRIFPIATPKVIIERRIYRDKESRFYVNGEDSSQQNIFSLFQSSGIYGYSFAIVGQGRVEEIVLAKPEEKKHIIDKIAGIDHFKRKKDEALKKLSETEENLARAYDRLDELRKETRRVLEESQKAHLYYILTDRLKKMEGDLYNGNLSKLRKDLNNIKASLEELEKEAKDITEKILEEKKQYDKVNAIYLDALENLEAKKAKKEELLVSKVQYSEKENALKDRIDANRDKLTELNLRAEKFLKTRSNLLSNIEDLKEKILKLKSDSECFEKKIDELRKDVESLQVELAPLINEEDEFKKKVNEIQEKRAKKENLIGAIEAESKFLLEKMEMINEELSEIAGLRAQDQRILQDKINNLNLERKNIQDSISRINESISLKHFRISELKKYPLVNEGDFKFQEKTLGYMLGLDNSPPGLEEELGAFVVNNVSDIKTVGSDHYFIDNGIDIFKIEELIPVSDILGVKSEFLANIFYAKTLSEAIEIFKRYFNKVAIKKIITLDGFVVLSPFEVKINTDIIAAEKKREAIQLENEIEKELTELSSLKDQEKKIEDSISVVQAEIFRAEQVAEKISKGPILEKQLNEIQEEIQQNKTKADNLREEIKSLFVSSPYANESKIEDYRNRVERLKEEISFKESNLKEAIYKIDASEREKLEVEKRVLNIDEEISQIEIQIRNVNKELQKEEEEIDSVVNLLNVVSLDLAQLQNEINAENKTIKSYAEKLSSLEVRIERLKEQREEIQHKKEKYNILIAEKETEIRANLREMEEKEIETREIPYSVDTERIRKEIRETKEEISGLGAIDFTSLEKEESAKSELEEKEALYNDVKTAKRELERFISETEKRIKEEFNRTLEAIESNFSVIFKKITYGGDAVIERMIDDNGEISGIELNVRFPGKRKQPLPLLSGGEKAITALAFLFSIFKVKKFPFYVLDEVDASLDEDNVVRFGELLKEESNNAQYIVITHNKQTMEIAEILYGVTMEEDGISKVVSLKLV